jgi:hypothetical protein
MSWQSDAVTVLRPMIGDMTEPFIYSDDSLETFALVASKRIVSKLRLGGTYTVNLDAARITPDPTTQGVSGESVMNMIELMARLTILEGEAKKAANQAIAIKDGPSSIDLKEVAKQKHALMLQAKKDLQEAEDAFQLNGGLDGNGLAVGHAVVGPIRLGYYGFGPFSPRSR